MGLERTPVSVNRLHWLSAAASRAKASAAGRRGLPIDDDEPAKAVVYSPECATSGSRRSRRLSDHQSGAMAAPRGFLQNAYGRYSICG